MLLYCNRSFFRVVLQRHGSIFLRTDILICSLVLGGAAASLQYLIDQESVVAPELPHHYGMHALGVVVAFAVVFRTNLGWQRYWESVTQLHFMYSKWADAYTQMYAFAQVTIEQTQAKGGEGSEGKVMRVKHILESLERNFGILSALSAHRLSHGDLQRMDKRKEMARWSAQIVQRQDLRGVDITGATHLPQFQQRKLSPTEFTKQDLDQNWDMTYVVKEVPSEAETRALHRSTDRVNMVMYWIVHGLAAISKDLDIAPPIQSRMYQELSNGMLGYSNCMKIADVPFPFPYAQLLTYLLVVYALFIPVYIVCFTKSMIAGPLLSFLLFQGIWGVNEVAKEIENPFGADINDISLADFHARFVDVLAEINAGSEAKLHMIDTVDQIEQSTNVSSPRLKNHHNTEDVYAAVQAGKTKLRKLGRLLAGGRKTFRRRGNHSTTTQCSTASDDSVQRNVSGETGCRPSEVKIDVLDADLSPVTPVTPSPKTAKVDDTPLIIGQEQTPLEGLPSPMANAIRPSGASANSSSSPETWTPIPGPSPLRLSLLRAVEPSSLAADRLTVTDIDRGLPSVRSSPPVPIASKTEISTANKTSDVAGLRPPDSASAGLMGVVDHHLAQIAASMERHLAQIAKELQTISGMQAHLASKELRVSL